MSPGFKDFDLSIIDQWLAAAHPDPALPLALTWLIHPYEVVDNDKTEVSQEKVERLRSFLKTVPERYELSFAYTDECAADCEKVGAVV